MLLISTKQARYINKKWQRLLKKEKNIKVVCKIDCKNYNKSYIDETKRQSKTRLTEHNSYIKNNLTLQ